MQTRLKHINIHNHWLRQEARNKIISVHYLSIDRIIIDRFIKALLKKRFERFKQLVGLINISRKLSKQRSQEAQRKLNLDTVLDILNLE